MNVQEILWNLKHLDFYTPEEWIEYLGYFEGCDALTTELNLDMQNRSSDVLLNRILGKNGMKPEKPDMCISEKIRSVSEMAEHSVRTGDVLGLVSGCYDLCHIGHARNMHLVKQEMGSTPNFKLGVLVLLDKDISEKKGAARPILHINERLNMLSKIKAIDFVIPLEKPDCLDAINKIRPAYFFKEKRDISDQDIVKREIDAVKSFGGTLKLFPKLENQRATPTTTIINSVLDRFRRDR